MPSSGTPELELRKAERESDALGPSVGAAIGGTPPVKIIRSYSMQFEADLPRIALRGEDIPTVIVGVGMGMEGGIGGV